MSKLYDCFLFYNELELLDLRLMVLNDTVDYFVLVESDTTFTGNTKDFIFEQNKDKYAKYLDKIIHIKVTDSPKKTGTWNIEEYQRNAIQRGLENAQEGDSVLISDVDEIPDPEVIKGNLMNPNPIAFCMKLFYYHVNCLSERLWNGTILSPYGYENLTPQQLRGLARTGINLIPDGGWHYTFLGGIDKVKNKFANLSDAHLVIDKVGDETEMLRKFTDNVGMWDGEKYKIVDVDTIGAPYIKWFIRRYPHVFYNRTN